MLNASKIESDINSKNLQSTDVSRILGLNYTTTIGRRKKSNWTPDDVERFADYFDRTIAYYFDRDEKQANKYGDKEKLQVVNEPQPCRECESLKDKIRLLEKINQLQEDKILMFEREVKKEKGSQNRAQAG